MRSRTVWLLVWTLIAILWANGYISWGGTLFILFVGMFLAGAAEASINLKAAVADHVDHGPDPLDDDAKKRQAQVEAIAKRLQAEAERMQRQQQSFREWERQQRAPSPPPIPPDAIALDRDDIVKLRNTLLRHHNSRGTDKEYQKSVMGADTTKLLQKLNELTQEKRRHD